ncbi:SDR family NAD(P)-dependent oxidoreductase [Macrococcus brunensis]|uniref:Diacetyl reductase [(S)-acetoin forming] n=1 Tax=Macrococcus brunensis TaxID=198483 RepID=A0A4R6BE05_9STAP|nr:SDR family NAD(P)-dependent oxidoreductase [Macrococcus brunensis]TDL98017.1 SDR family NAD(P)-dependent oxidoreductase [Macrococcus brunensis]ULG72347.1 SDR family NAD(P)-dependent oxidoreductase [Macrococcus brunensis]ULG74608.1 SDR family NAD(P)-dependent oxidoreductase [Macrococcus brunensis]
MENLTNKVALVTGGSRGIGRATAIALAKEGVKIAITGRHFEALQETLDMLETDATAVVCDMQKEEDIKAAVEHTLDTFGQIDILVNNAGIMKTNLFLKTSAEEMREMLETNVMGTFTMMQQVLPHMIEQKSGDVVNIASMSAINATAKSAAYSASKFAVAGMTEGVMREMREHNIRTFTINPSAVLTDLIGETSLDPETMTHPEDIADVIVSQLKLNRRTFIKTNQIWATHPVQK